MSEKINTKTGENTDVKLKKKVINFRPLDTKGREDDSVWNSMEFMCENDEAEAKYESPNEVSKAARENISRAKAKFIGLRMLEIFNMKTA